MTKLFERLSKGKNMTNNRNSTDSIIDINRKIMLTVMPFWAPLTPPLGISCLKGFLEMNGYSVKTVDANVVPELWKYHGEYLSVLSKFIDEEKRGNFYMVGYDVFMNHLMAHINNDDVIKYRDLVKILISKNFFFNIDDEQTSKLLEVVERFYESFSAYLDSLLKEEVPAVFGVTVYNSNLAPALFAFKFVKERYPDVITIMGGGVFADQLSIESENLKLFLGKTPYIDKILIGEGELLLLKLLKGELPDNKKVYTLNDINGEYLELSKANIPDFSDFNLETYPQLATYTSRSCSYQCSFCSETVQWGRYRKKNMKQVADELTMLYEKYGRQLFLLGDSLINHVVMDLADELIKRDLSIYWDAYIRADIPVCDIENTLLWRKAGYYRARMGLESGSQKVLDLMNKKITPEQIKAAVSSLAYAGIKTTTYWVLGHPGETEEDFQLTLDLVEELQDNIYEADFHPFFFYPTGQVNSGKWSEENGVTPLYPEDMTNILITQTWELNTEPKRETIYKRVQRFAELCKKCNIPNPYSLKDIYEADERWKRLHKNAVPSILEFTKGTYMDENKKLREFSLVQKFEEDDGEFSF